MAYSGKYTVKNSEKYMGDPKNVVYRSLWERNVMRWCDNNTDIVGWASEEVVIPYICETDNRPHRYLMDFIMKYKNGRIVLVEVKPEKETSPPKSAGRPRNKVLSEGLTYIKNQSKWKEAKRFCDMKCWHFEIWTEKRLTAMGLLQKPLKSKKPIKPLRPYSRKPKK